jgi:hypothetical protein
VVDARAIGRNRVGSKIKMRAKCDAALRVFIKSSKEFRRRFKSETQSRELGSIRAENGALAK